MTVTKVFVTRSSRNPLSRSQGIRTTILLSCKALQVNCNRQWMQRDQRCQKIFVIYFGEGQERSEPFHKCC